MASLLFLDGKELLDSLLLEFDVVSLGFVAFVRFFFRDVIQVIKFLLCAYNRVCALATGVSIQVVADNL